MTETNSTVSENMEMQENYEQQPQEQPSEGLQAVAEQHEQPAPEQKPEQSQQEKNFKVLREKAERAERERDELLKQLQSYQQKTEKLEEPEEDYGFAEDDYIEGKHFKKMHQQIKKLQSQIKQQESQNQQMATETRLKAQFPDFDQVVSRENVEALRAQHPEIAATLASSSDLYSSAVSAYKFMKQLGIGDDSAYRKQKETVERNASKPKTLNSVSPQQGDSPLSHANAFANGLTEDLKERLRKEMEDSRRAF